MRFSLLSVAALLISSTTFAATVQVDSSYLNSFGLGPRPPIQDSGGTTLQNGDVYQIVLWGNVGLTPADAGWDWYDYIPLSGDASLNPSLDTRIGNPPGRRASENPSSRPLVERQNSRHI